MAPPSASPADRFRTGQVITIFRSRLRDDANPDYTEMAIELSELARQAPGYVDHKVFTADDGERVTVVTFDSAESQRGWRELVRHRQAQATGRERFYEQYSVQVGQCTSAHAFTREA